MRTALGLVLVAIVTTLGVLALSDATKYRGESEGGGSTQVLFEVETKGYPHPVEDAAASLWYACVGAVSWHASTPPRPLGDAAFTATVGPALGEDARRRFRGCLEDGTVDKVRGDVERMVTIADAP